MKISSNIYYLSGNIYGQLANVYAIQYDEGIALFDCGSMDALDTIRTTLKTWNLLEKNITHVFLTHGHDDHAGCAAYFQKLGSKIVIGQKDAYLLEQGNFGCDSPFKNHFMPSCIPDVCITEDISFKLGQMEIEIFTMPGHTDGTLLYMVHLNNERILITGDFFFCDGERGDLAYTGWKGDLSYNVKKLDSSFKKLWSLNLKPTIILGGHGIPRIGSNLENSIMAAYKYHLINNR